MSDRALRPPLDSAECGVAPVSMEMKLSVGVDLLQFGDVTAADGSQLGVADAW
ncbi:hypothetical protein [Actinomadura miaoliensis]